jgi:hypothetical protein
LSRLTFALWGLLVLASACGGQRSGRELTEADLLGAIPQKEIPVGFREIQPQPGVIDGGPSLASVSILFTNDQGETLWLLLIAAGGDSKAAEWKDRYEGFYGSVSYGSLDLQDSAFQFVGPCSSGSVPPDSLACAFQPTAPYVSDSTAYETQGIPGARRRAELLVERNVFALVEARGQSDLTNHLMRTLVESLSRNLGRLGR